MPWLRPAGFALVVVVIAGCSARRDAPPPGGQASAVTLPLQGLPHPPTPGYCGPWETTDSAALATCRASSIRSVPGYANVEPGDCGYSQAISLAVLRECLRRVDSAAAQCPLVASGRARQADGVARAAEWHRCGAEPGVVDGYGAGSSRHYLLLRADSSVTSPPIFVYSNEAETSAFGLDTVAIVDLDQNGTDEILYVLHLYGTGAVYDLCAITVDAGRFRCWEVPPDSLPPGALRDGEEVHLGWRPFPDGPGEQRGGPLRLEPARPIWVSTPVFRNEDPQCCSSASVSLWRELVSRDGRFVTGRFVRAYEDSVGHIRRTDTLMR